MNRISLFLATLIFGSILNAQLTLDYYLPADVTYNTDIPTPKQISGHEVGEWHATHDKIYTYMLELARVSDRAVWEEYGRSHENRPLGHLIISSPENINKLEQLRVQHLQLSDPSKSDNIDVKNMPVFIKLGYGVHGNESSAQNASMVIAYYLTAGDGKKIDDLLKNAIILIDPCLNPDGTQRHSSWVNATKSMNNNPDANSWEFRENWPGGRTNHYWFDLNRDYIMLQQPESVGRVNAFFRWRPNINTDHHEMGADATFFFQPGIQSRNNPLVPAGNHELTAEIGKFHEKYLNAIGSLYYTEESFDDFYVGKGSSFPDIHGSVGILFEQAGTKGHLRETPSGLLTFPFAIRNHFQVSLSSLEAGLLMKEKLLDSQRKFYKEALSETDNHKVKAYVFSEPNDIGKTNQFIKTLLLQKIRIYKLDKDIYKDGITFDAESSYIVPLKQNEYRFIRSMFEPVKKFTDSTFYDISTWVLPMAYDIPYAGIISEKEMTGLTGDEITEVPENKGRLIGTVDSYAYLFQWNEYFTPKALYKIQSAGIIARVATKEFVIDSEGRGKKFSLGTIMIPAYNQPLSKDEIYKLLDSVAKECGITIFGVNTGLTSEGIDLGSNNFLPLKKPSVLMLVGDGINSSHAGEIWHLFDTRFNIPVTMITASQTGSINFEKYNVFIVAGSPEITPAAIENIKSWNRRGGTIVGIASGNNWIEKNKIAGISFVKQAEPTKKTGRYIDRANDAAAKRIPGAIYEVKLDLTHPICYGYNRTSLPVFKTNNSAAVKSTDIYNNPLVFSDNPLLSGYSTKEDIERVKGSAYVSIHGSGIISIYDNPNFRATWFGASKIFMNAVIFGQIIR